MVHGWLGSRCWWPMLFMRRLVWKSLAGAVIEATSHPDPGRPGQLKWPSETWLQACEQSTDKRDHLVPLSLSSQSVAWLPFVFRPIAASVDYWPAAFVFLVRWQLYDLTAQRWWVGGGGGKHQDLIRHNAVLGLSLTPIKLRRVVQERFAFRSV